jgi:DNA repair ATPase RecN
MRESIRQTECELSNLMNEIGTISSTCEACRDGLSLRVDEVNERLSQIETSSPDLSVDIQAVGRRCDDIGKQIIVHADDISKITKDLKELKDKVDQQPPAPVSKNSDSPCSAPPSVLAEALPSVPGWLDSLIRSEYPSLFE